MGAPERWSEHEVNDVLDFLAELISISLEELDTSTGDEPRCVRVILFVIHGPVMNFAFAVRTLLNILKC